MIRKTVYLLLDIAIKDQDKFKQYVEGHKASMQHYGGKLLFRSNDLESIEGNWSPKLVVVHEWPSEDAFKQWHDSVEYAPWKKLRSEAMDTNMVLAREMA
jgi:uncharacterized protein (DUF1330 family)